MARLGDIATYINGYAFKPSDWSDTGLPIIRIQDLTGNSYQANRYSGPYDEKYEVNCGDVLISWSASLGVYVWSGEKSILNQHIFKVVFDKQTVNKSFFVHQVQSILENAASQAHGATMKHLTKPVFDSLPFYLPPMEQQQHIAAVLDKITDLISLRKQQLAKLDELVKARFVEMFGDPVQNSLGWNSFPLDSCCDGIGDGLHGTPDYQDDGLYPFINGNNLSNGKIIVTESTKMVGGTEYQKLKIDIADNAILLSINGTLGKLALYNREKIVLGKSACYCNLKNTIDRNFVCALMGSDPFKKYLESSSTKSTIKNVGLKAIREYPLILPPKELQQKFSRFANQIIKQKLTIQQSLDKLEVLKKALMQEYFG